MPATTIPRGETADFLALNPASPADPQIEVIEGPNLQEAHENLGQVNKADGTFLQQDVTRRKVSGTQKFYVIDSNFDNLPDAGEVWPIEDADAAPYKVRIDEVADEGQTEGGYRVFSVSFHYFEDISDGTISGYGA